MGTRGILYRRRRWVKSNRQLCESIGRRRSATIGVPLQVGLESKRQSPRVHGCNHRTVVIAHYPAVPTGGRGASTSIPGELRRPRGATRCSLSCGISLDLVYQARRFSPAAAAGDVTLRSSSGRSRGSGTSCCEGPRRPRRRGSRASRRSDRCGRSRSCAFLRGATR